MSPNDEGTLNRASRKTLPAVKQWLREHPDETFTTVEIAQAHGLRSPAVSAALRKYSEDGTYPDLIRKDKSTWSLGRGEYRITRDAPLRPGARLEVIGHDHGGTVLARDQAGRLWVLKPLELPA